MTFFVCKGCDSELTIKQESKRFPGYCHSCIIMRSEITGADLETASVIKYVDYTDLLNHTQSKSTASYVNSLLVDLLAINHDKVNIVCATSPVHTKLTKHDNHILTVSAPDLGYKTPDNLDLTQYPRSHQNGFSDLDSELQRKIMKEEYRLHSINRSTTKIVENLT